MNDTITLTFEDHDKLDLKPFSQKLERFLMIEHGFVDGSLVVSLNAPFGAGKTTFLSMWKSDLDKRKEGEPVLPKAIIINAWESDYCGDPLLSILNGLIRAAGDEEPAKAGEATGRLREAAKEVGWFVTGLANNLVSHWTGLDPKSAGELAEDKKQAKQTKIPDFVTLYDERTKALARLKETLREVFGGDLPKAFLFVDELDRCRPDYAISYLETMKHVFDVHGLVFVLAVDFDQLECSAKALFGVDLRFSDYFRKFVQRTITLPEPDESSLRKLAEHFTRCYLVKRDKRASLMELGDHRIKNIVELIGALHMPPRQIQETFRIIGHTVAGDPTRGRLHWCIGVGVILMAALKVAEIRMYAQIGTGKVTDQDVGKFLINRLGERTAYWWFCVYITGSKTAETGDGARVANLFRELGFAKTESPAAPANELGQFAAGWGHHWGDRWEQIYQKIETATSF